MKGKRIRNLAAAMVVSLTVFLAAFLQWFPHAELTLQDAVYQREEAINPNIKIIAIDERTLSVLGQFETWTREPYARLIELLNGSGFPPQVIGLDVLLVNEKGAEDELLVEVCRQYDNIVLAENIVFTTAVKETEGRRVVDTLHIDMVEVPFKELSSLVQTGYANTILDNRDGAVRYTLLEREGHVSFAAQIAYMAGADRPESVDGAGGIYIDYTAGANKYETLSMIDVLEGRIPPQAFAGSIVLIGAEAAGMGDYYPIPGGEWMYGVEIHANIIQGLMENRLLVAANRANNALICAAAAFILTILCSYVPLWAVFVLLTTVGVGHFFIALRMSENGIIVNLIALPIALALILLWSIIGRYAAELLQKQKIMRAFRKYVAPQVVEEIAHNHNYQLKLGGEKRHIAVLFVDIRGFTPMSEILEPEQVVEVLNEYLSLVTSAVFRYGGTLDKFIGDAAMAVFNAPFDSEDYVFKAVCAARDIAAGSEQIARHFMERFGRVVSYGIGVNCGDAVVGNIGSEFRMDYTAIGDAVNTAARLESNAKPGEILISQQVYDAVGARVEVTPLGVIPLKGKSQGVNVYVLDAIKER